MKPANALGSWQYMHCWQMLQHQKIQELQVVQHLLEIGCSHNHLDIISSQHADHGQLPPLVLAKGRQNHIFFPTGPWRFKYAGSPQRAVGHAYIGVPACTIVTEVTTRVYPKMWLPVRLEPRGFYCGREVAYSRVAPDILKAIQSRFMGKASPMMRKQFDSLFTFLFIITYSSILHQESKTE